MEGVVLWETFNYNMHPIDSMKYDSVCYQILCFKNVITLVLPKNKSWRKGTVHASRYFNEGHSLTVC